MIEFHFGHDEDGSLSVANAVAQALGAVSMCWNPTPTGEFLSTEAKAIHDKVMAFIAQNPEGIPANTPAPTSDLESAAQKIVAACKEKFPGADPQLQQAMCFVEEMGEFQGEARRYLGLARREGNPRALAEELADVVITAYSVADVFGVEIDESVVLPSPDMDAEGAVWGLMVAGAALVRELDVRMISPGGNPMIVGNLDRVVALARHAAGVLDIDLNEEIAAKHKKIFERGWRDALDDGRIMKKNGEVVHMPPLAHRTLPPGPGL